MAQLKKVINGILALLIIAAILLVSDLDNRNRKSKEQTAKIKSEELQAIDGRQYKMGITYFGPDVSFELVLEGLMKGLNEMGYVKDSNLTIISQHANGEMANLQPIHQNMDNLNLDLILVSSTPGITAAVSAVKKTPMVFTMSFTPLEAGAGKSYTNHRPNITGVGSFPPVEATIDFIKDIIPETKKIGTLYNSSEINSVKVVEKAHEYLRNQNIELVENTVTNTSEVYQAISALCMRNVDAVWITGDNTAIQAFHGIAKVCRENRVPLIINDSEFVKDGALAAVGVSWYQTGYHTASFVAKVLNGENPANIPIENYVEKIVSVNAEMAEFLNIDIPQKYTNNSNDLKGKNFKFCLAHYVDSPNSENCEHGIRDELKNMGLEEGTDFSLKVYNAQGDISTLNSITDAIAAETWDLVFVTSTPTIQAISKKVTNSPVVFTNVGDPIRAGLGKSFTDHHPNLTGVSTMSNFDGMVTLVKESMPNATTIGTIYTPGEINSVAYKERLEKAASDQGLNLIAVPANSATEVADAALSIANRGIDAFTQISDNLTASSGSSIIKVAYDNNIPYFAFISEQVDAGAIAAIASDYYYAGVDATTLALKVLSGTPPGDIPYQFVSQSKVKINSEAADFFNVSIPEKYIQQTQSSEKIQQPFKFKPKIAMVHYVSSPDCDDVEKGILERFNELGHKRNIDFIFEQYNANADIATLNNIAKQVSEENYDLIFVTVLAATQALASKIKNTPILFTVVADPVGNKLGKSYTNHIPNITGIDGMSYTNQGIDLVREYIPDVDNIGVLFCPGEMASVSGLKELEKSCKEKNIGVVSIPVNTASEVIDATQLLCSKNIDAICQLPDNCTIPAFASMVKVSQKEQIPLFSFITSQVEMGAIAAIAGDYLQQGHEIADIGIRVLNGESPRDIPFSRIKTIETVINPSAANAYGLKTPTKLMETADKIIQ
ncbi:MAG: ABC transporter substrate-binding protein [Prolixibacteraceae bacterium]|nr:ABC transporter substrate-binding protein [Prolixibacteraceae bacterium]MBN2650174.1 ABC transporter substrate-binding protein [Prolixibacteraceae bacterium]